MVIRDSVVNVIELLIVSSPLLVMYMLSLISCSFVHSIISSITMVFSWLSAEIGFTVNISIDNSRTDT